MTLSEFITYCTLKGLVQRKMKVRERESAYDVDAEAHYKISISSDDYQAVILYATVLDQAVIIKGTLYKGSATLGNLETIHQPTTRDLVKVFCS